VKAGRWQADTLEFGRFRLDGGAMFGVVPKTLWSKLAPADELNRIDLALRCLLLRDGERVVLVDCGVGGKDSPKFREIFHLEDEGRDVSQELARFGLAPEDVTDLILTHLHFDHGGGAVSRDDHGQLKLTFPNASVHVQRGQWDWALNPSQRDRASYLKDNLEPLKDARLNLCEGDGEVLPGVSVRCVHGHTPFMQLVEVAGADGEPGLVYCADLVPTSAHLSPPWVMGYDLEPLKAMQEKSELLERVDGESSWLVFEHDPAIAALTLQLVDGKPVPARRLESL
jgi:glyoxylase-like metal-dependent hydrolase (beta-lactamase superfamily II)